MRYEDVYAQIRARIAAAPAPVLDRFGAATLELLLDDEEAAADAEIDLDDDARAALATARASFRTASAAELRALLDRIDEGTVADGDMGPELITALEALDSWQQYRATGAPGSVGELAVTSLEAADHREPAGSGDFLGSGEVAREHARILTSLDG